MSEPVCPKCLNGDYVVEHAGQCPECWLCHACHTEFHYQPIPIPTKQELESPNTPARYALWGRHHWSDYHARNLLLHFIHHRGLDQDFLSFLRATEISYNVPSELVEKTSAVKPQQ